MNPQAMLSVIPWGRRIWRLIPARMRVPALLLAGAAGIANFVLSRRSAGQQPD